MPAQNQEPRRIAWKEGERVEPVELHPGEAEPSVMELKCLGPREFEVVLADDSVRVVDIDIVRTLPNGSAKLGSVLGQCGWGRGSVWDQMTQNFPPNPCLASCIRKVTSWQDQRH